MTSFESIDKSRIVRQSAVTANTGVGDRTSHSVFLNGWKEIAMYVGRGVRTVQRWESLGLPVRRPKSRLRSAVLCSTEELDAWLASCGNGRIEEVAGEVSASSENYGRLASEVTLLRAHVDQLRAENEMLRTQLENLRVPQDVADPGSSARAVIARGSVAGDGVTGGRRVASRDAA